MISPVADPGSFRDPAGRVHHAGNRVFRTISRSAAGDYEAARDRGIYEKYSTRNILIGCTEVAPDEIDLAGPSAAYVVEHPRIPFVSYPYEWSFALLKEAALFHLDFQVELLEDGFVLSDATAYNVQFRGPRPVFIDLLSIREYRDGEYWLAHNQFCEQFLNPLLLRAYVGLPHNDWFRGRLEGIPAAVIARTVPAYRKLSFRMLTHVLGPARLQARSESRHTAKTIRRPLPRSAYLALLQHLRRWIQSLKPAGTDTQWQDYDEFHSYSEQEEQAKKQFVGEFVAQARPGTLWDIGCNTGEYSAVALQKGADKVIAFDFDHGALDRAVARAQREQLDLLPLFLDGANPSPSQGWAQRERMSFAARADADAIIALAFIHHLVIGRNIPLDDTVDWLTGLAPRGLIEFVQKDDPTVRDMLALREDVFEDYSEKSFLQAMTARSRVVSQRRNPDNGRLLVVFERDRAR